MIDKELDVRKLLGISTKQLDDDINNYPMDEKTRDDIRCLNISTAENIEISWIIRVMLIDDI